MDAAIVDRVHRGGDARFGIGVRPGWLRSWPAGDRVRRWGNAWRKRIAVGADLGPNPAVRTAASAEEPPRATGEVPGVDVPSRVGRSVSPSSRAALPPPARS